MEKLATEVAIPKRSQYLTPRHGVVNVLHVLLTHALLVAWFWIAFPWLPLAASIPLSLLVCVVHQRAMSEWIHEGAHFNLVPNRKWNDRLTDALAGVWFGLPVRTYRAIHFAHHRRDEFFVDDDPDTVFLVVGSRREFWRGVVRDLTGVTILRQFARFQSKDPTMARDPRFLVATAVVHVTVLVLLFRIGWLDAAILYYVSLATLYPLLNRLRTYGQHAALDPSTPNVVAGSRISRTIDAGLLDRLVHTSPRLMYHHEHHRHPYLPYRALRGLVVPDAGIDRYSRSRWGVLRAVYVRLPR
jgi:fatty acid desaturase